MCRSTAPPSAEPPPMMPQMPCLAMKSKARSQALWCRHQRDLLERIAAIRHLRRDRIVLALVRERFALERLEQDINAFLEQFAVGLLVAQRRAERLGLAGVIAARDTEDHPAT